MRLRDFNFIRRNRMNVHKNARLTPRGREWVVIQAASGQPPQAIAGSVGGWPRTARKWIERHQNEGTAGLFDRSSRPHRLYRPTPPAGGGRVWEPRRQPAT